MRSCCRPKAEPRPRARPAGRRRVRRPQRRAGGAAGHPAAGARERRTRALVDAQQLHAFCGAGRRPSDDSGTPLSDPQPELSRQSARAFVGGRTDVGGDSICPDDSISMAGVASRAAPRGGERRGSAALLDRLASAAAPREQSAAGSVLLLRRRPSWAGAGRGGVGRGIVLFKVRDASDSLPRARQAREAGPCWWGCGRCLERAHPALPRRRLERGRPDRGRALARRAHGSHRLAVTAVCGDGAGGRPPRRPSTPPPRPLAWTGPSFPRGRR